MRFRKLCNSPQTRFRSVTHVALRKLFEIQELSNDVCQGSACEVQSLRNRKYTFGNVYGNMLGAWYAKCRDFFC